MADNLETQGSLDSIQLNLLSDMESLNSENSGDEQVTSDVNLTNSQKNSNSTPHTNEQFAQQSLFVSRAQRHSKLGQKTVRKVKTGPTQQLEQVRKTLMDVTDSFKKEVVNLQNTFHTNTERSHIFMANMLKQHATQIQRDQLANTESLRTLSVDMSNIMTKLPDISKNTDHIRDIQIQLQTLNQRLDGNIAVASAVNPGVTQVKKNSDIVNSTLDTQIDNAQCSGRSGPVLHTSTSISQAPKLPFQGQIPKQLEIKKFDGKNMLATQFLKQANKYFALLGITDEYNKFQYFEYMLSGKASLWFHATEGVYTTWPTLQKAFIDYFQGEEELEKKKREWDASYLPRFGDPQDFILESISLLKTIHTDRPFNDIANMIIHKLPRELRYQLRISPVIFDSPEKFIGTAKNILYMCEMEDEDDVQNKQNYIRSKQGTSYSNNTNMQYNTSQAPQNFGSGNTNTQSKMIKPNMNASTRSNANPNAPTAQITQTNISQGNAPNTQFQQANPTGPSNTNTGNRRPYLAPPPIQNPSRDSQPTLYVENQSNGNSPETRKGDGVECTIKPHDVLGSANTECTIMANIGPLPVFAKIDTGTNISLMSFKTYSQIINVETYSVPNDTTISVAIGTTEFHPKLTIIAPIMINNNIFWQRVAVFDNLRQEVLLGTDFLTQHKINIDVLHKNIFWYNEQSIMKTSFVDRNFLTMIRQKYISIEENTTGVIQDDNSKCKQVEAQKLNKSPIDISSLYSGVESLNKLYPQLHSDCLTKFENLKCLEEKINNIEKTMEEKEDQSLERDAKIVDMYRKIGKREEELERTITMTYERANSNVHFEEIMEEKMLVLERKIQSFLAAREPEKGVNTNLDITSTTCDHEEYDFPFRDVEILPQEEAPLTAKQGNKLGKIPTSHNSSHPTNRVSGDIKNFQMTENLRKSINIFTNMVNNIIVKDESGGFGKNITESERGLEQPEKQEVSFIEQLGINLKQPSILIENENQSLYNTTDTAQWVQKLKDSNTDIQKVVEKNSKKYYKKTRKKIFEIGDLVKLQNFTLSSAANNYTTKFTPVWKGPYIITKKISDLAYHLMDMHNNDMGAWNIANLDIYHKQLQPQTLGEIKIDPLQIPASHPYETRSKGKPVE